MAKHINADAFLLKISVEIAEEKARKATDIGYHAFLDGYLTLTQKNLDEMPAADVVEVVRCKDCKYFTPQPDTIEACCDLTYSRALPDDYCSYAERRNSK